MASKKLEFDRDIYAHKEVRVLLEAVQHGKCCYCETRIAHVGGDVEHFRPKSSIRRQPGGVREYPGYFWLAYEWDNLYLACRDCNEKHKSDVFPLQNEAKRARSPQDRLGAERPTLIDPKHDPCSILSFDGPTVVPVRGNERGRLTIECLGLNRSSLEEDRRTHIGNLRNLQDMAVIAQRAPEILEELGFNPSEKLIELDEARRAAEEGTMEYAAMARVVLGVTGRG